MAQKTSDIKPPEVSIGRLSLYSRLLKNLSVEKIKTISSRQLAEAIGIRPEKVRKDLSYFGQFGQPGVGYEVEELNKTIDTILGLDRKWNLAICGAGNLGSALCAYRGFAEQGFEIVAVFDNDPSKVSQKWKKVEVISTSKIRRLVKEKEIEIVIIAVPASAAQAATDEFVNAGVKAILNFAPTKLTVPQSVKLRNVDLSTELVNLSHFLAHRR